MITPRRVSIVFGLNTDVNSTNCTNYTVRKRLEKVEQNVLSPSTTLAGPSSYIARKASRCCDMKEDLI